jgi:hypothetical protein
VARFAQATAHFLHILVPAGLLQVVAECLKKYLQVQGFSTTVEWSVCIASVIGVIANYGLMKEIQFLAVRRITVRIPGKINGVKLLCFSYSGKIVAYVVKRQGIWSTELDIVIALA